MYKKLFLMAAVLFCFLCTHAFAVEMRGIRWKEMKGVSGVYEFNINAEVNALRQAKRKLDIDRNFDAASAYEEFYAKQESIISQMRNRRRAEYASVNYFVARECEAHASSKSRPGAGHKYDEGDVWVHHPDTNTFEVIPGTGDWQILGSRAGIGGATDIKNPRTHGTENFCVHLWAKGGDFGQPSSYIKIDLHVRCRYKSAVVDQKTQADMGTLINRLKSAAGVN